MSKAIIKDHIEEHKIVETICSLYSSLSYKNEPNKQLLSKEGVIDILINVFEFYVGQKVINSKAIKQILRALGNCSLETESQMKIVNSSFMERCIQLIENKLRFKEQGDMIRFCLDVISNLSNQGESPNKHNSEKLLQDGALDLILQ